MTHDDTPMWEDPQESSALRQLLRAGSVENSDYDVERGLARHLAQLQAGAPLPAWAVQTTLQKSASWSLLAWLLPPAISAGVVGVWLAIQPAAPAPASLGTLVPAQPNVAASQVSEPAAPAQVVPAATEPAPSRVLEPKRTSDEPVREPRESVEHHDNHSVSARNPRPASRATGVRRGRSTRPDDVLSTSYAAVAQPARGGNDVGTRSDVAKASDDAAAAAKEVDKSVAAAPVSPAAQDIEDSEDLDDVARTRVEEATAKPGDRRAKEEASAKVDEVSGARLEREMRMLAVAQRVLTEDPARSLRLCRQGESEFRGSMFSAERKQVALLALVQLGKVEQARREGIPFLRAFPNAPWSARLREALTSGKLPKP